MGKPFQIKHGLECVGTLFTVDQIQQLVSVSGVRVATINDVLNITYDQTLNTTDDVTFAQVDVNGTVHATAFFTDSLREFKTNIVPTSINAIDLINSTEIVEYNYKSNVEGDTRIGFIADDTDAVFSSSAKNQFDLANTVGVLMKAIQELSAKNIELEARISQLEQA